MYDVFISYAEQDGDWAGRLAERLRADDVRVFFDKCSLRPGDVVVHELEAAIRESAHGVLVVGPHAVTELWARQEYAALVQAAARNRLRLIPVLFGDADIPPFAATRVWMDFRKVSGPAFDAKAAELAGVLRGEGQAHTAGVKAEALGLARPSSDPAPHDEPALPAFVVCYARGDAGYGERLADHLSGSGFPVWSLGDLTWGDDYLGVIRARLRQALAVVVLMSPQAEEDQNVTREILEGQRHSRKFFPILVRGEPNYLLASSWYFDARNGELPGSDELLLLRQLYDSDRPGPASAWPPPVPVPRTRPRAAAGGAGVHATLSGLETLLVEREVEHADLLTTTLLLEAVGRLEEGWMRRSDGERLPGALLSDIDGLWSRLSDGRYGFGAQTRQALLGGRRHADFMALSLEYGWRASLHEAVPKYQHFAGRAGQVGFFPTLRNPQNEQYRDWYDQWAETALSVHQRLRERGWLQ